MVRSWQRIFKLLIILIPVLSTILLFGKDTSADQNHNHFIHDHIAPVPALIAQAAQQAAVARSPVSFFDRIAASASAAPAAAPADVGQWSNVIDWPLVAVHTALLPDQKVLMFDAWEFGAAPSARLWDPNTQNFISVPNTTSGLFCAGQVMLADGRQLLAGGHNGAAYGINHTNIFNWQTDSWLRVGNMNFDRWYPTTIMLGDGRIMALGGQEDPDTYVHIPEVFDPATNSWTRWDSATIPVGNYPYIFLMPNGKVFNIAGNNGYSSILDVGSQTWTNIGVSPLFYVNAVMYRPGQLMMVGGASDVGRSTYVIDLNQASPAWRQTAQANNARFLNNLVSLPDGKVLSVGGSTILSLVSTSGVLQSEMWDPDTETWTPLTPMQTPRLYHSTALLLPDGRVLVAGGGRLAPAVDYPNAEIYSPPYLFNGARPTITSAPSSTTYGANMTVNTPDAAAISSVSFVRLSSVTHAINTDQRYIPLTFTQGQNSLTVQAPTNANIAPPGYYMLFILNGNGVPSVAKIVQIGGQSQPGPTATPTNTPIFTATPSYTPTPTATFTPTPVPGGSQTISAQINTSSDDVNEVNGSLNATSSSLWIGNADSPTTSFAGLRFNNLAIPRGASITAARLEFYSVQSQWLTINFQLAAEAADSSATFSAASRPSQRPLTTARVNHASNLLWAATTWYPSEDVSALITEVINRPGWQSGNSLAFILRGTGGAWGRKFLSSLEANPALAVRLVVTFTT